MAIKKSIEKLLAGSLISMLSILPAKSYYSYSDVKNDSYTSVSFYVSQDGNDNNDGLSWNTAFKSIDKALFTSYGQYHDRWIHLGSGFFKSDAGLYEGNITSLFIDGQGKSETSLEISFDLIDSLGRSPPQVLFKDLSIVQRDSLVDYPLLLVRGSDFSNLLIDNCSFYASKNSTNFKEDLNQTKRGIVIHYLSPYQTIANSDFYDFDIAVDVKFAVTPQSKNNAHNKEGGDITLFNLYRNLFKNCGIAINIRNSILNPNYSLPSGEMLNSENVFDGCGVGLYVGNSTVNVPGSHWIVYRESPIPRIVLKNGSLFKMNEKGLIPVVLSTEKEVLANQVVKDAKSSINVKNPLLYNPLTDSPPIEPPDNPPAEPPNDDVGNNGGDNNNGDESDENNNPELDNPVPNPNPPRCGKDGEFLLATAGCFYLTNLLRRVRKR